MSRPTVYADFHNADPRGRVRLNCAGTMRDLDEGRLSLTEGLKFILPDNDLEAEGDAHFSEDENLWVAVIDWKAIRRRSV